LFVAATGIDRSCGGKGAILTGNYPEIGSKLRHKYQVATVRQGSQLAATSRASLRDTGSPEK
jgi:hypothetical protein